MNLQLKEDETATERNIQKIILTYFVKGLELAQLLFNSKMSFGENPSVDINRASAGEDGEIMDLRKEMDKIRAELEALAIASKIADKFPPEIQAKIKSEIAANRVYLEEISNNFKYYSSQDSDKVVEEPIVEDSKTSDEGGEQKGKLITKFIARRNEETARLLWGDQWKDIEGKNRAA